MRTGCQARHIAAVMMAVMLIVSGADSDSDQHRTVLRFFYTAWCRDLCHDGVVAVSEMQATLKEKGLGDKFEAIAIDCSSLVQGSICCNHGINTYPTVHISPVGSNKYWVFQGDRTHDQMLFGLMNDTTPKVLMQLQSASTLGCTVKGLKYSGMNFLTRTMTGSITFGIMIGLLSVYIYLEKERVKFGENRVDWPLLVGTILAAYYMIS